MVDKYRYCLFAELVDLTERFDAERRLGHNLAALSCALAVLSSAALLSEDGLLSEEVDRLCGDQIEAAKLFVYDELYS